MTPDQTHTGIRMNQLLTKCLTSWPTPESSARTILCLIMAVGKDESVFSWLTKPNVTLLVTFINEDALKYNIPKEADRFFFFNPFSVEIFKGVLANIMDSFYYNHREMYMIFYYPSDEYLMCLSQEYGVSLYDEIDCRDISFGEARRERMVVYRIGENTEV